MRAGLPPRPRPDDRRYALRVRAWESLTETATPFLLEALALSRADRVVDIGCGLGGATRRAAEVVGREGIVVGVDVSAAVVRQAARRATGWDVDVRFQQADAQFGIFRGGPFTAAMSQFGVMFFDDPPAAFGNIRRQLLPAGRMCFTCWQSADRNPWSLSSLLADLLPGVDTTAADGYRSGPFAFADPDLARQVLLRAGFRTIGVTARHIAVDVAEHAVVDDDELSLMGVPAERMAEARDRVAEHLAGYRQPSGLVRLPLAFFVVTATPG